MYCIVGYVASWYSAEDGGTVFLRDVASLPNQTV